MSNVGKITIFLKILTKTKYKISGHLSILLYKRLNKVLM